MLKLYLGVFLGLSQVSGECNYRFVTLCNTGLVHPAGSILNKMRENGGEGERKVIFYCSTLPSTFCCCERAWIGSDGEMPKPNLTQGWCHWQNKGGWWLLEQNVCSFTWKERLNSVSLLSGLGCSVSERPVGFCGCSCPPCLLSANGDRCCACYNPSLL